MFRIVDTLLFTLERLWQHRALVLWALVGLSAATTLALSLVLYVDAVNTNLLASRLSRPPYAFRFRYLGSWDGSISRNDVTSAAAAVQTQFAAMIGLPVTQQTSYISGGTWTAAFSGGAPLGAFTLGALEGAGEQMTIVSGQWPPSAPPDDVVPVLLPEGMLYSMGLQVGDRLTVTRPGGQPVTLWVAALWRPTDADDPAWVFTPKFFDKVLLLQTADLWRVLEEIERPVEETAWFTIFDGGSLRTSDVGGLLERITDGERAVTAVLPGVRLDLSPSGGLTTFSQDVSRLTQQLVIIVLPVAGLVLYFVALVARLLVSRQQQEDAVLRSRGMSRRGILSVHILTWLLLAGFALVVGSLLCPAVVRLVGQTTSFLRFDDVSRPLQVVFTPQALAAGAVTGLIAASSGLYHAWRSSIQTITSLKRDTARASKAWWQRMYLDALLFIPAGYMLYTLWRQGGLAAGSDDPFSDPLAFVGPTLFSFSLTLLFLRLWPLLLRLVSRIIAYGNGISLLMALRELTRSIDRYRGTLLMMVFTLSLTGFTASMASTIDRSLEDSVNYRIGADMVLVPASDAQTEAGETDESTGQTRYTVTGYNTLPPENLLDIPGVAQVSRVGHYPGQIVLASQRIQGTILGVDRAAMAAVTRFRPDYAGEPLADLLNQLAGNRTGVLLSRQTARDYNLRIGQSIPLQINVLNNWYETTVPIVGLLDYFPTLNPTNGFFLVTNLDPIFETVGTELPHDLWLSLLPGADRDAIRREITALGYPILEWRDPETALQAAKAAPSRRGVLGFLSVGFVASILLTLVASIIQNAASLQAQSVQLGSLRAMGLGWLSVGAYLVLVQGIAAGSGVLSGTLIGTVTTLLYLPLLDFSGGLPPYLVRVAWNDIRLVYALFAGVLLVVTFASTLLLGRGSLSAVLKLGDV